MPPLRCSVGLGQHVAMTAALGKRPSVTENLITATQDVTVFIPVVGLWVQVRGVAGLTGHKPDNDHAELS